MEGFFKMVWAICSFCEGSGASSAYLGSWSSEEWAEEDEDFREDYMQGQYDKPCDSCGGSGKVQIFECLRGNLCEGCPIGGLVDEDGDGCGQTYQCPVKESEYRDYLLEERRAEQRWGY